MHIKIRINLHINLHVNMKRKRMKEEKAKRYRATDDYTVSSSASEIGGELEGGRGKERGVRGVLPLSTKERRILRGVNL